MIKRRSRRKKVLVVLGVVFASILLVGLVLTFLERRGIINLFEDKPTSETVKTTSQAPTAQSDFSDGGSRQPVIQGNSSSSSVLDNNGEISPSTPKDNPIVSSSGEISVYSPSRNALIASGQEISGASTLSVISYRIIDDVQGVSSSGELKVVNGKFAGKVNFNTPASQGRIDLFGARTDGTEFSNVEIPVRFK